MSSALLAILKTRAAGGAGVTLLLVFAIFAFKLYSAKSDLTDALNENIELNEKVSLCLGLVEDRDEAITTLRESNIVLTESVQKQNEIIESWKHEAAKLEQARNREAQKRAEANRKAAQQITREHRFKSGAKALTEYFRGLL